MIAQQYWSLIRLYLLSRVIDCLYLRETARAAVLVIDTSAAVRVGVADKGWLQASIYVPVRGAVLVGNGNGNCQVINRKIHSYFIQKTRDIEPMFGRRRRTMVQFLVSAGYLTTNGKSMQTYAPLKMNSIKYICSCLYD